MQFSPHRVTVQQSIHQEKTGARPFFLGSTLGIGTQDFTDIFCSRMSKLPHPPIPGPTAGIPSSRSTASSSLALVGQEKNNIFVGRERELKGLQEAWATAFEALIQTMSRAPES